MFIRDYFWTTGVRREYGEQGIEQCFIREFCITSDFYLEGVLRDIRSKGFFFALDRIGSNLVSAASILSYTEDIGAAIPLIVLGMSEVYRYRQYQKDLAHRKRFEQFRRATAQADLRSTPLQRKEFKEYSGLDAPF